MYIYLSRNFIYSSSLKASIWSVKLIKKTLMEFFFSPPFNTMYKPRLSYTYSLLHPKKRARINFLTLLIFSF